MTCCGCCCHAAVRQSGGLRARGRVAREGWGEGGGGSWFVVVRTRGCVRAAGSTLCAGGTGTVHTYREGGSEEDSTCEAQRDEGGPHGYTLVV